MECLPWVRCFVAEELTLDGISLLISRETPKDPPQYYVRKYPDPFNTTEAPTEKCITNFPHPYEKLRDLQKVALTSLQLARVAHLKLQLPTPIRRANNVVLLLESDKDVSYKSNSLS